MQVSIAGVVRDIKTDDFLSLAYSSEGFTLDAYWNLTSLWNQTKQSYRSYCSAVGL